MMSGGAGVSRATIPGLLDDWVAREGVAGYPAPGSPDRYPLFVRKIYRRLGLEIPADFPTSRGTPVGPNCPACKATRGIPDSGWYVHEKDTIHFATLGGSRVRPRGGGVRFAPNTAYYHAAHTCTSLWTLVHKHVRAHPEDKDLFDPVPAGADAYSE